MFACCVFSFHVFYSRRSGVAEMYSQTVWTHVEEEEADQGHVQSCQLMRLYNYQRTVLHVMHE
jgi:hypothetical protein